MESILFHGSDKILERPSLKGGRLHNDFGQGFYCTPDIELAREWACRDSSTAFANHYSFEPSFDLKVCDLSGPDYHVLNWLAVLMNNRVFKTKHPLPLEIKEYILQEFLPDLSGFDIIRGYRADDSYYDLADSFLNGYLSIRWLDRALHLGNLGEQVFLNSPRAFEALVFTSAETVDKSIYYPRRLERDRKARDAFKKMKGTGFSSDGVLAVDVYREKWRNDDARLR